MRQWQCLMTSGYTSSELEIKFKVQVSLYFILPFTGGPPLTRKSLTRFPLTRFLAYVRVSGGISVSRGPQYSPTNTSFM